MHIPVPKQENLENSCAASKPIGWTACAGTHNVQKKRTNGVQNEGQMGELKSPKPNSSSVPKSCRRWVSTLGLACVLFVGEHSASSSARVWRFVESYKSSFHEWSGTFSRNDEARRPWARSHFFRGTYCHYLTHTSIIWQWRKTLGLFFVFNLDPVFPVILV